MFGRNWLDHGVFLKVTKVVEVIFKIVTRAIKTARRLLSLQENEAMHDIVRLEVKGQQH